MVIRKRKVMGWISSPFQRLYNDCQETRAFCSTFNANGKEYIIDYPDDLKGKSKRNMTEEEKRAAQEKSMQTKARRAKTAEN